MQPKRPTRGTLSGMRLIQKLIGLFRRPMAESQARGKTLEELATDLAASGKEMDERIAGRPDTRGNREAVAHWVGIERWGQRRLRVALGEPMVLDTHHPYLPDVDDGLDELRKAFAATREETVSLARRLEDEGVDPSTTVRHNDLGDMSVAGWLAYLIQHPEQEAYGRLRGSRDAEGADHGARQHGDQGHTA